MNTKIHKIGKKPFAFEGIGVGAADHLDVPVGRRPNLTGGTLAHRQISCGFGAACIHSYWVAVHSLDVTAWAIVADKTAVRPGLSFINRYGCEQP